jgi:hypothetical protein
MAQIAALLPNIVTVNLKDVGKNGWIQSSTLGYQWEEASSGMGYMAEQAKCFSI